MFGKFAERTRIFFFSQVLLNVVSSCMLTAKLIYIFRVELIKHKSPNSALNVPSGSPGRYCRTGDSKPQTQPKGRCFSEIAAPRCIPSKWLHPVLVFVIKSWKVPFGDPAEKTSHIQHTPAAYE